MGGLGWRVFVLKRREKREKLGGCGPKGSWGALTLPQVLTQHPHQPQERQARSPETAPILLSWRRLSNPAQTWPCVDCNPNLPHHHHANAHVYTHPRRTQDKTAKTWVPLLRYPSLSFSICRVGRYSLPKEASSGSLVSIVHPRVREDVTQEESGPGTMAIIVSRR